MLKFLRDIGSSLTSGETTTKSIVNGEQQKAVMVKKNKTNHAGKTFKVNRKDVVEELQNLTTKYPYMRPVFLGLRSQEELHIVLKHSDRLITLPKRSALPRAAGYAECTNAGKSLFNEDQAAAIELNLGLINDQTHKSSSLEESSVLEIFDKLTIFGVFDGHAGADVAVTVSHELPHRIKERIADVIDDLKSSYSNNVQEDLSPQTINTPLTLGPVKRKPTVDRLITGALEAAFQDMDTNLVDDEMQYTVKGGCAAVVSLFYANKLYVANAGDCRAVMSLGGEPVVMSHDFTPESERRRLQTIAERSPDLLADEFCPKQFTQRLGRKDLGTQMLYRDSRMEGWAHKTVKEEDLRFPMIMGDGRRSRLLATIGLTRGLGDHNLQVFDSGIRIKPFLSCIPEVKVHDFSTGVTPTANDVVILGSDGLWDVITNREAIDTVKTILDVLPVTDNTRYIAAAQALLSHARGILRADRRDIWVLRNSQDYASHDDISCFVIPLSPNRNCQSFAQGGNDHLQQHDEVDTRVKPPNTCEVVDANELVDASGTDGVNCEADINLDVSTHEGTASVTASVTEAPQVAEATPGEQTSDTDSPVLTSLVSATEPKCKDPDETIPNIENPSVNSVIEDTDAAREGSQDTEESLICDKPSFTEDSPLVLDITSSNSHVHEPHSHPDSSIESETRNTAANDSAAVVITDSNATNICTDNTAIGTSTGSDVTNITTTNTTTDKSLDETVGVVDSADDVISDRVSSDGGADCPENLSESSCSTHL